MSDLDTRIEDIVSLLKRVLGISTDIVMVPIGPLVESAVFRKIKPVAGSQLVSTNSPISDVLTPVVILSIVIKYTPLSIEFELSGSGGSSSQDIRPKIIA
jgi:hypothetical protein